MGDDKPESGLKCNLSVPCVCGPVVTIPADRPVFGGWYCGSKSTRDHKLLQVIDDAVFMVELICKR